MKTSPDLPDSRAQMTVRPVAARARGSPNLAIGIVAAVLVAAAAAVDVLAPRGMVHAALYVFPLAVIMGAGARGLLLPGAIACSVLCIGGHFVSRSAEVGDWYSISSRIICLLILWVLYAAARQLDASQVRGTRTYQELVASKQFVEDVLENLRELVLVLDRDGQVLRANSAFYALSGLRPEQTVGRKLHELPAGNWMRPAVRARLQELVGGAGSLQPFEVMQEDAGGRERTLLINARRVCLADNGDGGHLLIAGEDVTEGAQARRALERSNRELRERTTEMEQFVFVVSHDLKSPLVTINGFLSILKQQLSRGEYEKAGAAIERISSAATRMGQLIEDLLALSRIGRVRSERTAVNLRSVIDELERQFATRLQARSVRFAVADEMPTLMAERGRVVEAIGHLVANALKYGCGAEPCAVEFSTWEQDDLVCVAVRDHGPGVPAEHHARVFRVFERLDHKQEGTGIGLAIVARIMEVHGGRAWVEDAEGGGALFVLGFPRAALVAQPAEPAREAG